MIRFLAWALVVLGLIGLCICGGGIAISLIVAILNICGVVFASTMPYGVLVWFLAGGVGCGMVAATGIMVVQNT